MRYPTSPESIQSKTGVHHLGSVFFEGFVSATAEKESCNVLVVQSVGIDMCSEYDFHALDFISE